MFLVKKGEKKGYRCYVRILELCLVALGVVLLLILLNGTDNAEGDTVVPGGPVNDALYPGGWNALGSPYWVEGDIFVPNGPAPAGGPLNSLTIDGAAGPVEIRFNGSYSFRVGIPLSGDPASLFANANGNPITFTRNGSSGTWLGIQFTDSVASAPPSRLDGAIIEYTGGGLDIAVWLDGTTNVYVINSEIRHIAGAGPTPTIGIGLLHSLGGITDNNFIIGNYIHNISSPGPAGAAGILLANANANTINGNIIENVSTTGGPGTGLTGILLQDSSYNTLDLNVIMNYTGDGDYVGGITLRGDSNWNDVFNNNITEINGLAGEVFGLGLLGDISGGTSPENNTLLNNTIEQIDSVSTGAYGLYYYLSRYNDVINMTIENITCSSSAYGICRLYSNDTYFEDIAIWNVSADSAYGIYLSMSDKGSFELININNIESLSGVSQGLVLDGTSYEDFKNMTISNITSTSFNTLGISTFPASYCNFTNIFIENIIAMNGQATGIQGMMINNESFTNVTVKDVFGNSGVAPAHGVYLVNTIDTEIVSLRIIGVSNLGGDTVGFRSIDSQNLDLRDSEVSEVSADLGASSAIGVLQVDSFFDVLYNVDIMNISSFAGQSVGIRLFNTTGASLDLIRIENVTTGGISAVGIDIDSNSAGTIVQNSEIKNILSTVDTFGIYAQNGADDTSIETCTISTVDYGIYVSASTSILIGNNTIHNNLNGIWVMAGNQVDLINNHIYDNTITGLWMDVFSSANWIVDASARLTNNDGILNGSLSIWTTGDMLIQNATLQTKDVFVNDGGQLQVIDSKNTIISWDLYIDGLTILDNSNWEINNTFDGEHKIQVNATGNLQVINGSLITAYNPLYRYDFWVNGSATFLNSTVEYVGYSINFGSVGIFVTNPNVIFDDMVIRHSKAGIIIQGVSITVTNVEIYNCTAGIGLSDASSMVLDQIDIHDMFLGPEGFTIGIFADNYTDLVISNVTLSNLPSLMLSQGIMANNSQNLVIENSDIIDVNGFGIYTDNSNGLVNNVNIVNGTVGIQTEDSKLSILDTTIINQIIVGMSIQMNSIIEFTDGYILDSNGGIRVAYNSTIYVNGSLIENQTVSGDTTGIFAQDGTAFISDTTILNQTIGVNGIDSSNITIDNSFIYNSVSEGVVCDTTILSMTNTIIDNATNGVVIRYSMGNTITNSFINNTSSWAFVGEGSETTVSDTTFDLNNNTIYVLNSGNMLIINSSITNGLGMDFMLSSDSHIISLNTSFDNSSVNFMDVLSTLTVQWYLHVRVENISGFAVLNANVQITDNENGSYDSTFMTDGAGYVNWITITEYVQNSTIWTYYSPYTLTAWNATMFGTRLAYISQSMLIIVTLDTESESLIGKIADNTTVIVGEYITYTLWYNNTGIFNLTQVYLNDTLDSNLEYFSDNSGSLLTINGNTYSWDIGNVTPGNHSFQLIVRVKGGTRNGTSVPNNYTLYYSDHNYIPQTPMDSNLVFSMVLASEISIEKSVENLTVDLGGLNTYTIWYNNTGGVRANVVWVNDTFHTNLTIITSSAEANRTGNSWEFFNVEPGTHFLTVVVQLDTWDGLAGTEIGNQATLEYLDIDSTKKPSQTSNYANFSVPSALTVDYIRIEYSAGGLVSEGTIMTADDEIVLYARGYNNTGGLVGDVDVNWLVNGVIGDLSSGTGTTVTFNATTVGIGNISVTYVALSNITGNITVIPGAVAEVMIDPAGPEINSTDDIGTYKVYGYDSDGNLNKTWIPEWSWDGPYLGDMTPLTPDGYNYSIDFNRVDTSFVRVNVSGFPSIYNTSEVIVNAGAVVNVVIDPAGPETNSTDDIGTYKVYGYDSDGNLNTTWIPEWSWDGPYIGDMIQLTPDGYTYSIYFNRVDTSFVRVNVSGSPSIYNTSQVTVTPGKVVDIIIIPGGAETNTTDEVLSFRVEGYDADGNFNFTWIVNASWTGPDLGIITVIGYDVTVEYTTVGSSLINVSDDSDPSIYNNTKSVTVNVGLPYRILYVSGRNQFGLPSTTLLYPFIVRVEDFDGNPVPNVEINWSLDAWPSGATGQLLSDYNILTNATGEASTTLTLGDIPGMYFVNATNVTLTLIGEPISFNATVSIYTIDEIFIGNISSNPISNMTLSADDTITLYAWAYNYTGGVIGPVSVNWSSAGGIGVFTTPAILETQVTFDPTTIGIGNISIEFQNATLTLSNITGDITVIPGAVTDIEITPFFVTKSTDDSDLFTAVGYDLDGNENWTWIPIWGWEGTGLGILTSIDLYNYTVSYDTPGFDVINVSLSGDPNIYNTASVTIFIGQIAKIKIEPWPSTSATTDDIGSFNVTGYDADDNVNWSWYPVWNWEGAGLGILTSIDMYNYTVTYDTVGSDVINVSFMGDPNIYNTTIVEVIVGQVIRIEIMPWPSTLATTDDIGSFNVTGYDADNNKNWTWTPSWNWEGAGLGTLNPIDLYNYTVAYDTIGLDTINVTVTGDPNIYNSTIVEVIVGQVIRIEITPWPSSSHLIGDTGNYGVVGYDIEGYENWSWSPIWSWEGSGLGILTEVTPYNYTVNLNTEGSDVINVSVSGDPSIYNSSAVMVSPSTPTIDYILIVDSPGPEGNTLNVITMNGGESAIFYAVGYNATSGEFVDNISVTWEITTEIGTIDVTTGYSTNFTASNVTGVNVTGTLTATYNSFTFETDVLVDLPPEAPIDLSVSQRPEGKSLILTWTENIESDVEGYRIYRSTTSGTGFSLIHSVLGASTTSYINTGLTDGTTYYYRIEAYDSGPNYSPASFQASGVSDTDTDGDNTYNLQDDDDDGDGLTDTEEESLGTNPLLTDTDGDGHNDLEDKYPLDATKWKEAEEEELPIVLILLPIIVIIIVLLLVFMLLKKRKPKEELPPEAEPEEGVEVLEEEAVEEIPEDELGPLEEEEVVYEEEPEEAVTYEEGPEEEMIYEEELEEEAPEEEAYEEEEYAEEELEFECPDCGTPVSGDVVKCPKCGAEFEEVEEEEMEEE